MSPELCLIVHQLARAAGMRGPPHPVPKTVDWERWLRLVDENDLGPFLASRLPVADVPRSIAIALRERYARAGHEAAFRHVETMHILQALEGTAEPILLKGSALVSTL